MRTIMMSTRNYFRRTERVVVVHENDHDVPPLPHGDGYENDKGSGEGLAGSPAKV
jgi:hypothetical protein